MAGLRGQTVKRSKSPDEKIDEVTLEQAVLGGRVMVPTLAGPVTMTVPKWSNSGTVLRLKGKGAPGAGGARGDEYVTLKVMLPDKPDPELERFLTERAARTRGARQSTEA